MLVGLGHWYYQREHYHDTFDWTTELSPDQFPSFRELVPAYRLHLSW
jgi:hypothetical protein